MMSNGSSKNKLVYVVSFSQTEKQSGYFFSVFTLTPGLWFGCSRFLVLCKSKLGFSQMYTHLYSHIRLFDSIVFVIVLERNRLYINLFPGPREDVASAYSLFQGRKTGWVGEKRKIGWKKLLSPSPSSLPSFFLSLRCLFRATFQRRSLNFQRKALGMYEFSTILATLNNSSRGHHTWFFFFFVLKMNRIKLSYWAQENTEYIGF